HEDRQRELQCQLEAAEMLAQAEDDLRTSSLFLAAVESRIGEDPFVTRFRSALKPVSSRARFAKWSLAAVAAGVMLIAGIAISKSTSDPKSEPEIARITELNGSLQWTGGGGRIQRNLEVGRWLRGGTLESLATDSWGVLEFRDGSRVTISGQAVLTISEDEQKELYLGQGRLSAEVTPQPAGKPMIIHTPTSKLEILGTQFNVDTESSSTVVTVKQGRVRVTRLADDSVVEVPADYQVVAAASRQADFNVTARPSSVTVWQSQLPAGIVYGKWQADSQGLQASPLLWRNCIKKEQVPLLLHLTALSDSRGEQSPVELRPGARFRIRGRMDSAKELLIGLTTQYLKGGFAGKHHAVRKAETFSQDGGNFELEVPVEEFTPEELEHPKSAVGLGLYDWWCLTVNEDAGLSIFSVELLAPDDRKNEAKE
ncbi:MAG: FecR family protein, partial [Planctomycetales bacterium]